MARPLKQIPELSEKDKERFFAKVSMIPTAAGCLEWLAYKDKVGYGQFRFTGKPFFPHRIAYFIATNVDPLELEVRHSCNNPSCVNSAHLSLGTSQDNADDMVRAGRAAKGDAHGQRLHPERTARGERAGLSKLTEPQVRAIRTDLRKLREIALDYGVHMSQIGKIKRRKVWAHVD